MLGACDGVITTNGAYALDRSPFLPNIRLHSPTGTR
jgi:hypothetical protein